MDPHQVRALQIQTMRHTAKLHLRILPQVLQRHFLAAITPRVIDLAEAATTYPTLDRVARQRPITMCKCECHDSTLRRLADDLTDARCIRPGIRRQSQLANG